MTKKEEQKLIEFVDGLLFNFKNGFDLNILYEQTEEFINQNYISKEQILSFEELKEESTKECISSEEKSFISSQNLLRNKIKNKIHEQI